MARTRTPLFPVVFLLATVALSTVGHAQTTTWTFISIADSSAELASFSVPSINDSGQIAFVATFDNSAEGQVVYRKEANGVLTVIADTSGPIASFRGDPNMNASGLVTFTATMDDGSVSVRRGDGSELVTIANTNANGLSSIDSQSFIGDDIDGTVVTRAVRSTDGARVILTGTGGPPATLLDSTTGPYDPVAVAGINDDGVVAFVAVNGAGETGIYRATDGVVTAVAETSPGGFVDLKALDINDTGTVVYFRQTAAGNGELVVDTAGTSTRFADTADPSPFASFGPASVAETGATAFYGFFDGGLKGIFAGGTGLYEKAIAINDSLLGSGVTALDTGPQAVTNAGQFVFRASRGDGTTGIYVASAHTSGGGGGGGGGGAMDGASLALLLLAKRLGEAATPRPGNRREVGVMKKVLKYGLGGLAVLVLLFGGYLVWTQANKATPAPDALAAMHSDARVSVEDGQFLVFRPTGAEPTTGVIFYPGAACDIRGYAPVLRRVAERGYLVVDVPMPIDMAVFAPNRADDVRAAFPAVKRWVIAGHSMGGAMAAHYAHRHPDDLAGLLLWDSGPAASDTLVDLKYPVWHIHRATADGRPPENLESYRQYFPAMSTWIPVPGGIHMYFGSFVGGGYKEQWTPTISREAQQDIAVTGTLNALLAMAPAPTLGAPSGATDPAT